MNRRKIAVTTDCTSDLSDSLLDKYGIGIIYFSVVTDSGCFCDCDEITSMNVLELIEAGGSARSLAPDTNECIRFFTEKLKNCEELIHITMSSEISYSYRNCTEALKIMGEDAKRIKLLDSRTLSTGTGHIAIRASKLASEGKTSDEIIEDLKAYRSRVSTSFLVRNADYLFANGKVSEHIKKICDLFGIHPLLEIKNGKIHLKRFWSGNYENAEIKYITSSVSKIENIDPERVFITHAGCTVREINAAKKILEKNGKFKNIYVTEASATVSSNCGPNTIGIIFIRK